MPRRYTKDVGTGRSPAGGSSPPHWKLLIINPMAMNGKKCLKNQFCSLISPQCPGRSYAYGHVHTSHRRLDTKLCWDSLVESFGNMLIKRKSWFWLIVPLNNSGLNRLISECGKLRVGSTYVPNELSGISVSCEIIVQSLVDAEDIPLNTWTRNYNAPNLGKIIIVHTSGYINYFGGCCNHCNI